MPDNLTQRVQIAAEDLNSLKETIKTEIHDVEKNLKVKTEDRFEALEKNLKDVDKIKADLEESIKNLQKEVKEAQIKAAENNLVQGNDAYVPKVKNINDLQKINNKYVQSKGLNAVQSALNALHIIDNLKLNTVKYETEKFFNEFKSCFNELHGIDLDNEVNKFVLGANGFSPETFGIEQKSLTVGGASGTSLFPNQIADDIIFEKVVAGRIPSLFREITQTKQTFPVPYIAGQREAQSPGELTAPDSITYTDGDITWVAKPLVVPFEISDMAELSSVIALLPIMMDDMRNALLYGETNAIINGDTTTPHQDTDTAAGSTKLAAKAWNGLRKLTNSAAKVDLGTLNETKLISLRIPMGAYGQSPDELAYIVSLSTYIKMLMFDKLLTVDKFSTEATLKTGVLASFNGIPVINDQFVREDLDSTGVNTAPTDNKTICLLVNHREFIRGILRGIVMERERLTAKRGTYYQIHKYESFNKRQPSTENVVAMGVNIAT